MDIGFPAQQRGRINAGAMGLVAELDAAEIILGPLLPTLETPNHHLGLMEVVVNPAVRHSAPGRH